MAGRGLGAIEKKQNGTLAHKYRELPLRSPTCTTGTGSLKPNDDIIIH